MKDAVSRRSLLLVLVLAGSLLATAPGRAQEASPSAADAVPAAPSAAASITAPADPEKAALNEWQKQQDERLVRGNTLLMDKQAEAAIREAFDPVIQAFEARYGNDGKRYYSARTSAESLAYMLTAAADMDKGVSKQDAVALGPTWAYAHYSKAYALIELNRFDEAAKELDRALQLAPHNPQFLGERAYLYRASNEWDKMLQGYRSALEFVDLASPDDRKVAEEARALRGEGYALIELGDLKSAEKSFKKSLKLEPGNELALGELDYIKKLKKKKE